MKGKSICLSSRLNVVSQFRWVNESYLEEEETRSVIPTSHGYWLTPSRMYDPWRTCCWYKRKANNNYNQKLLFQTLSSGNSRFQRCSFPFHLSIENDLCQKILSIQSCRVQQCLPTSFSFLLFFALQIRWEKKWYFVVGLH